MSKIFKCALELGELICLKSKAVHRGLRAEPLPELAEIRQEIIQGEVLVESFSVKEVLVIVSVRGVG